MNDVWWIRHFTRNRLRHNEPRWELPVTLDAQALAELLPAKYAVVSTAAGAVDGFVDTEAGCFSQRLYRSHPCP
ncbi:MAG: hypothetical protein HYR88_04595 [Verrucomicrobia bacterium]|nr:hypothetical protein [Verrucomicrobiota bacterium]MBI3867078.1 hypothetical protein [Verrucomicrobiota bacterium]